METVTDHWNWKLKVDFTDKVGGAFATAGGKVGDPGHVVVSLALFMLNNRMIVAGPLYENQKTGSTWGEAGAGAVTGPLGPGVNEGETRRGPAAGPPGRRTCSQTQETPELSPGAAQAAWYHPRQRTGSSVGVGRRMRHAPGRHFLHARTLLLRARAFRAIQRQLRNEPSPARPRRGSPRISHVRALSPLHQPPKN